MCNQTTYSIARNNKRVTKKITSHGVNPWTGKAYKSFSCCQRNKNQDTKVHKALRVRYAGKNSRTMLKKASQNFKSKSGEACNWRHLFNAVRRNMEQFKGKPTCSYCLADISTSFCFEHVEPHSKGGSNENDNLVLSCRSCNSRKSDKDILFFYSNLH